MITFVVRFWPETSAGEPRWRGQIEHVQSGEGAAFLDIGGMLSFLRRFGVEGDDQGHRNQEEAQTTKSTG
jgi:hypothetical protein